MIFTYVFMKGFEELGRETQQGIRQEFFSIIAGGGIRIRTGE
jgi:hypothetical protein